MKTLLVLALVHAAVLLVQGAAVPTAGPEPQEATPDAVAPVLAEKFQRQARFSFCLDDWSNFRGNCYYLGNGAETWANAESFCASFGANLASVGSRLEYNYLQRLLKTGGHSFGWIGGYYFEDAWRWADGSAFGYDNWDTEDSSNLFPCIQMDSGVGQGWSNQDCGVALPFVCRMNPNC